MKKLVIFLILFIVSIPAFAQDESLFTENFSLVKDPEANNLGLFSFNISFPASYLFFTENRRHSRQHQAFQIIRSHQFSDRTPLSRTATVENRKQNWGDMYNFIYGQQENISSEEESESFFEQYLKREAERAKKRRIFRGWGGLIGGGALMAVGASMTSKESVDYMDLSPLGGGLSIIMGIGSIGAGIYYLATPSHEERVYEDYLKEKESKKRKELALRIGIMPYGGVKISLALSF